MQRVCLIVIGCLCFTVTTQQEAAAQSGRAFGSSLSQQASPGGGIFGGQTAAPAATIPGAGGPAEAITEPNRRFLRQNRSSNDFVGKNSAQSGKFVGSVQTDGTFVKPAAADAVERSAPVSLLNPARTPVPKNRMYEPRLSVGFRPISRPEADVSATLQKQVYRLNQRDPSIQVTTIVVGQTVHLQGNVGSEEQRALIEQMMLFEPGISSVQNDLRVLSAAP